MPKKVGLHDCTTTRVRLVRQTNAPLMLRSVRSKVAFSFFTIMTSPSSGACPSSARTPAALPAVHVPACTLPSPSLPSPGAPFPCSHPTWIPKYTGCQLAAGTLQQYLAANAGEPVVHAVSGSLCHPAPFNQTAAVRPSGACDVNLASHHCQAGLRPRSDGGLQRQV